MSLKGFSLSKHNKSLNFAHSVRWTAKSYAFVCQLAYR